jgi:hypothetical protein
VRPAGVVFTWARSDAEKAARWVEQLPAGSTRDAAASEFAVRVVEADPESASIWAASIGDPNRRENALRATHQKWKAIDKAAAVQWLRSTSALSEDAKQRLLLE